MQIDYKVLAMMTPAHLDALDRSIEEVWKPRAEGKIVFGYCQLCKESNKTLVCPINLSCKRHGIFLLGCDGTPYFRWSRLKDIDSAKAELCFLRAVRRWLYGHLKAECMI